jgi:hypothetical protein
MSVNVDGGPSVEPQLDSRSVPRIDRIVIGLLIGAIGVGLLLDQAGVSVPWRILPAAALVLIGFALLATLLGGRGRGALIGLGIIATVFAVLVGVGADHYAGPVGDQLVAPTTAEWPVQQDISAGTLTVDLTRHPLPESGHLQVNVGAGEIDLVLPHDATPAIDATATAGTITVDGVKVGDGLDVRWSEPSNMNPAKVVLELHVGLGDIGVRYE